MSVKINLQHREQDENGTLLLCRECRHANHETRDYNGGFVACKFSGGLRYNATCDMTMKTSKGIYYLYEPYNNSNCTWFSQDDLEIIVEK